MVQLSPALARLAAKERYLALEVQGCDTTLAFDMDCFTRSLRWGWTARIVTKILAQMIELPGRPRAGRGDGGTINQAIVFRV